MDTQDDPQVIEGEVASTNSQVNTVNAGELLVNMEGMIKNYVSAIDKQSEELKKLKEMLDDIFKNDPTYHDHDEKAKEANKVKAQTKGEILKRAQPKELNDKIKTLKSEISEAHAALSDYLQEYQRMSGVNEIEGEDGQVREIVYTAKLIKKSYQL